MAFLSKPDEAILSSPHIEYAGMNARYVKVGENCYLHNSTIGDYSYLSKNVSMMNTKVGKFCSISQGVCIALGKHPTSNFVTTHPMFFSTNKQNGTTFSDREYFEEMGRTVVGNDVWIGCNAVVMDDITIGNGAIIGAGAVVTKNVPPYAIVTGVPARIIRYRFTAQEIAFLEKFKWWDRQESWLMENYKSFHDLKLFMKKFADSQ